MKHKIVTFFFTILMSIFSNDSLSKEIDAITNNKLKAKYFQAENFFIKGDHNNALKVLIKMQKLKKLHELPRVQSLFVKVLLGQKNYIYAKEQLDILYSHEKIGSDLLKESAEYSMGLDELAAAQRLELGLPVEEDATGEEGTTGTKVDTVEPTWITDSRNGCKIWNPYPKPNETVTWAGACNENGFASGDGVVQWFKDGFENGVGKVSLKRGRIHGYGEFKLPYGDIYIGNYKNGLRDGHGELKWASGASRVGNHKNGRFHGYGVQKWPDGSINVIGMWVYGKFFTKL